jgi:hypothetical protein
MTFSVRFFFTWFLLLGGLTSLCLSAQTVPPPPVQRADRFGIYNWGVDYAAYPASGTLDRLNWAADKVAALGSRTIRVALPGDVYLVNPPGVTDLAQIATSPAYDKLFSDPRLQTYLLTAYSASDMQSQWSDGYTTLEAAATRDEFRRFGEYLLSQPRFAGKTFILLNWEGDNAMEPFANKPSIWEAYTGWIQARADGVKAARQRYPNSAVKLFSGLEFNLLRTRQGIPCGAPNTDRLQQEPLKNRCVIDYVAPRVDVDYYSYSAWQTVLVAAAQRASLKDALHADLSFALAQVRASRPAVEERNFLLGEFGFQRTHWGETVVANLVNEMFDALEAPNSFSVSYAIFWQIIDNVPTYLSNMEGYQDGFGLYRSRYGQFNLTRAGLVFQKRLAGQAVTPYVPRPLIKTTPGATGAGEDGAQNIIALANSKRHFLLETTRTPALSAVPLLISAGNSDRRVEIDALNPEAGFSPRDNAVRLEQGVRQFSLPYDFAGSYSESEMQITVGLPTTLQFGAALLYVTDREGVESNARRIRLSCQSCPVIAKVEDSLQLGEFYPGGVVTLSGSDFSLTGNTVIIEQQDAQGRPQRFVVIPDEVWSESMDRITLRLPPSLLPHKLAVVSVIKNQRVESIPFLVWITRDCATCAPALRRQQAMVNRGPNSDHLYPGANVSIRGARLSANGNKVVIEAGQQRFVLASGAGWSETTTQITTTLPRELSAGYARFYIVDAQGRESSAQTMLLTHAPSQRRGGRR